jgi:Ribbon-helix-helix protein, copG family
MLKPRIRYSARCQARLDAKTHAEHEAWAPTVHRKRSAILRYVMQWGIARTGGWTVDMAVPETVHLLSMLLESALLQQVQEASAAQGASMAAWVREAVRRVTRDDFPEIWRAGVIGVRSHDSHTYGQRFMLRLDEITAQKLQELVEQVGRSRAEIIRQLVAQATLEAFPPSWQLAAAERQRHPSQ